MIALAHSLARISGLQCSVGIQMIPSSYAVLRRPNSGMPGWLEFDNKILGTRQVPRQSSGHLGRALLRLGLNINL